MVQKGDEEESFWPVAGPDPPDEPDADRMSARPAANTEAAPEAATGEAMLAAWISRVVDHDQQALSSLYAALAGRVYGLALRITGRAPLAEEVVEDTFWQVWRQAPRFDPDRGTASAWIMTIARSRALDARRGIDRAECEAEPEALAGIVSTGEELPDLVAAVQREHRLQAALARLDPVLRQLVAFAFFRGLTHEEIANHAGLPLGTVKSHIRRALIQLREALARSAD